MRLLQLASEWWEVVLVAIVLTLAAMAVLILGACAHYPTEDELDWQENQRRWRKRQG